MFKQDNLIATALNARKKIIKMAEGDGCFLGSALSCVDIITYLYSFKFNINKIKSKDANRDFFFLSKGHAVPALYSVFSEVGLLQPERLNNHLKLNDDIYWHPNTNIPGVEFLSGSLGHNLSVAIGVAINSKLFGLTNNIYVMLGDGELNEGSIWENLLIASAYKLDNLVVIIDRNGIQANEFTEKLIPLDNLTAKFEAFNCAVFKFDGHDFNSIHAAFSSLPIKLNKPNILIAKTIRGKGVNSLENKIDKWYVKADNKTIENYIKEIN